MISRMLGRGLAGSVLLMVSCSMLSAGPVGPAATGNAKKLDATVTLTDGHRYVKARRRDLAIGLDPRVHDGAARFRVDREVLQKTLRRLSPRFGSPPRDARLVPRGSSVRVFQAVDGRKVDPAASAVRIANVVERKPATRVFPLVMTPVRAKMKAAAFKGITGRLSQFATTFNPANAKRAHNLRLAAQSVDGQILKPGQVFSLNGAVGARSHENGFLTAKVFEDGKETQGIGGGVSQVASTAFNAALLAGLPIVQYQGHSRPVHYLPVGRDATVAWNLYDLKFKNNTSAPIFLACSPSGSRLAVALYGAAQPGRRVALRVNAKRPGPTHIKTTLVRVIKRGGTERKEVVGHWEYKWQESKKVAAK